MKKILFIITLIATATAGHADTVKRCTKKNGLDAFYLCQYNAGRAPAYFTGCLDVYAPEKGLDKAVKVCTAEYEQHKHNKKAK